MTQTFNIVAIVLKNRRVTEQLICLAGYDRDTAMECITHLEATKDKTARLGTLKNPLRYEAVSKGGRLTLESDLCLHEVGA